MKTLLLLRHAKSSWDNPGVTDHDRPLNQRGEHAAPDVGRLLREQNLIPERILSSTALRARQTAEIVAQYCGYTDEIALLEDLYQADPSDHIAVLQQQRDEWNRILLVAHNPGLEELLTLLTEQHESLPTAALVHLQLPIEEWRLLADSTRGQLVKVWRPREWDI